MSDEPRVDAWNRRLDWPLTALAVVFLGSYAWSVLDTSLDERAQDGFELLFQVIWVLFGIDYLARVYLARRRWRFVGTHIPDLVVLLLPMFRQLRALRLIIAIGILNRELRADFRGRVAIYVGVTVVLVCLVASLAVLDAERDAPNATITSFGDALWWTITTISTVGYGDRYPTTGLGRLVAVGLMVVGIALLGVVTASVAAFFVSRLQDVQQAEERTEATLSDVLAELREVRARLDLLDP